MIFVTHRVKFNILSIGNKIHKKLANFLCKGPTVNILGFVSQDQNWVSEMTERLKFIFAFHIWDSHPLQWGYTKGAETRCCAVATTCGHSSSASCHSHHCSFISTHSFFLVSPKLSSCLLSPGWLMPFLLISAQSLYSFCNTCLHTMFSVGDSQSYILFLRLFSTLCNFLTCPIPQIATILAWLSPV